MEKANKLTLASDLLSNSDFIEVGCLCIFAKTIFFSVSWKLKEYKPLGIQRVGLPFTMIDKSSSYV